MTRVWENLAGLLPGRRAVPEERKSAGAVFAIDGLAQPAWSPRNYAAYAREGMMRNAVAYRCIRMIAEAAASSLPPPLARELVASGAVTPLDA